MSGYAYRDEERKNIIYASSALEEDRGKMFFCPNIECGAHLYLCAVDGSTKAYFRSTKQQYQHTDNCPYKSGASNFREELFDEKSFVFNNAIINLFNCVNAQGNSKNSNSSGSVEIHPPRTLRQIYSMCKSHKVSDVYGDKEIGDMLLDDRSIYRYHKGCFGYKIIEAHANKRLYDKDKKLIFLSAPCNCCKYTFVLKFCDEKLFNMIKNELYSNKEHTFAIAGNWKKFGIFNYFISDIISRRQVLIIK